MATPTPMPETAKANDTSVKIDTKMRVGEAWVTTTKRETAPVFNPGQRAGYLRRPHLVADFTKAVHKIGSHLAALQQRIDRLQQDENRWTTRGWEPPPGADSRPRRS